MTDTMRVSSIGTQVIATIPDGPGRARTVFEGSFKGPLTSTQRTAAAKALAAKAENCATLEAALRTIQSAIPGYLKHEMTAEDFALIVIGAADSAKVVKALEKGR